jgi:hypothetical protein
MFLGLPDPDPLVIDMDPDPDPSIIFEKGCKRTFKNNKQKILFFVGILKLNRK